jgi:hypothetical protein
MRTAEKYLAETNAQNFFGIFQRARRLTHTLILDLNKASFMLLFGPTHSPQPNTQTSHDPTSSHHARLLHRSIPPILVFEG